MKKIIYIAFLILIPSLANSQVKAITQHGRTVILYDDGTWEYENVDIKYESKEVVPQFNINTNVNITTGKKEIFNAVSKKLARFFGEEKGKIISSATCTNENGNISLNFEFMLPVGDANRYFGYSLEGRKIILHTDEDVAIESVFTKNSEQKFMDKFNISYYKGTCELSNEDAIKLMKNPVSIITVDWKKTKEEYYLDENSVIQNLLIEAIK